MRLLGLLNTFGMELEDMISDGIGIGGTHIQKFQFALFCLNYFICKIY